MKIKAFGYKECRKNVVRACSKTGFAVLQSSKFTTWLFIDIPNSVVHCCGSAFADGLK